MWSPAVAESPSSLRNHLGLNWGFAASVAADPGSLLLNWEGISDCGITEQKGGFGIVLI